MKIYQPDEIPIVSWVEAREAAERINDLEAQLARAEADRKAAFEDFNIVQNALIKCQDELARDHNSLKVTENTPRKTPVIVWNEKGYEVIRIFSHYDNGRIFCFQKGKFVGETEGWNHAERYIGQHFIPWDGRVTGIPTGKCRVQFGNRTVAEYYALPKEYWENVTGYIPITDNTGNIDWERVPR